MRKLWPLALEWFLKRIGRTHHLPVMCAVLLVFLPGTLLATNDSLGVYTACVDAIEDDLDDEQFIDEWMYCDDLSAEAELASGGDERYDSEESDDFNDGKWDESNEGDVAD